jgi:Holliday junction resolvase RusA-like endonuclease
MNQMKKKYKMEMSSQIGSLPRLGIIEIHYKLFPKTKRLCDVNNICSAVDKFFSDALVELGKLQDDNYLFLPRVISEFGEVDPTNPRVEITIKEI